jgi:hypothetical protein
MKVLEKLKKAEYKYSIQKIGIRALTSKHLTQTKI